MLKTRVKTAIVLIIITVPVLCFSYIEWVRKAFEILLSVPAVWELLHAGGLHKKLWLVIPAEIIAVVLPFVTLPAYQTVLAIVYPLTLIFFIFIMLHIHDEVFKKSFMPCLYVIFLLMYLHGVSILRACQFGLVYYICVICASIGTDTAAYFIGSAYGKHKLAPDVSPHKSLEGSLGGITASVVLMLIVGLVMQFAFKTQVSFAALVFYGAAGSVVGQIGDLSMSTVKRIHGIKDYSNLLPGHGGILDRFDSVTFLVPFTLIFVMGINPMFV